MASCDIFQASLLSIVREASSQGINHFFETKKTELHRFLICEYIRSISPCHPLRSQALSYPLRHSQQLSYRENDSATESNLKREWTALLQCDHSNWGKEPSSTPTVHTNDSTIHRLPEEDAELDPDQVPLDGEEATTRAAAEDEVIDYKSIGRAPWIYIIQNFCSQRDKIRVLPLINLFFNDMARDSVVWRELYLKTHQINTSIPLHPSSFSLVLSVCCRSVQSVDFESLAQTKTSWHQIWTILSAHCLVLKNIHIGTFRITLHHI